LKTGANFDFEAKSSYSVRVQSTDGAGGSFSKQFTISVKNLNEEPTDIALTEDSIDENQPSGTTIGALSATDPDTGQTHTFALANGGCGGGSFDNGSFSISGGELKSAEAFNFEAKDSYTICVRATDSGLANPSFDKQFTIRIIDVNDPPFAGADSYSGVIGNTLAVLGTSGSGPHVVLTGNVLNSTGTSGGLTATGSSGDCTFATPTCTGGTIQGTTGAGVSLTNTANVSLTRVRIVNAGTHGVQGTGVNNPDFSTMLGNISGTLNITNSTLNKWVERGVYIENDTGSLAVNVTNSTFQDNRDEDATPGTPDFGGTALLITRTGTGSSTSTRWAAASTRSTGRPFSSRPKVRVAITTST
jgi:hypothetical protein